MKRIIKATPFFLVPMMALLFIWGCDQSAVGPTESSGFAELKINHANSQAQTDEAFTRLAKSLAAALADEELRFVLKGEFEQKYTGGPEVLYSWIKAEAISGGRSLHARIAQVYAGKAQKLAGRTLSLGAAKQEVAGLAGLIPRLHIAMPVHLSTWDAKSEVPLVAYVPSDVSDTDLERVKSYDASGKLHWLDASAPPDFPVIVLAENERANNEGEVRKPFRTYNGSARPFDGIGNLEDCPPPGCGGGGGGGGGGGDDDPPTPRGEGAAEYIHSAFVINDHESWLREPADITAEIVAPGAASGLHTELLCDNGDPEPEDEWVYCNDRLLRWYQSDYGNYWTFVWREVDDYDYDRTVSFSYTYEGVTTSYSIQVDADDVMMGRTTVNIQDPSMEIYEVPDLKWKETWKDN